jgi:hypothetical protein
MRTIHLEIHWLTSSLILIDRAIRPVGWDSATRASVSTANLVQRRRGFEINKRRIVVAFDHNPAISKILFDLADDKRSEWVISSNPQKGKSAGRARA